ncbi:nuclear transport factor 2 family protein [Anaerolinea sp.]|uniref:nuclear transport factor 2 family protein n=1 Tax=Anaerolinea sp. TaxID=1872519 RepID=UPI002ACD634F|nr:nuclear transport factor 2 family protein [Anaerolinea sp.]
MKLGKVEAPVRLALAFFEACNRQALKEMLALLSADCLFESPVAPCGSPLRGRDAIAACWREFFAAHPGARFEVQDVFGAGFRSVARWTCTWTSPDDTAHSLCGVDVFRIIGENIAEQVSFRKGE